MALSYPPAWEPVFSATQEAHAGPPFLQASGNLVHPFSSLQLDLVYCYVTHCGSLERPTHHDYLSFRLPFPVS